MSNTIKQFNNKIYRKKCLEYLPLIRNIIIPPINNISKFETVFIDFRWLPHIEYLVRNTIIKLPKWKHTIICGNNNIKNIINMCKQISSNINIIHLIINTCSVQQYSNLLLSNKFWNMLSGEKILIYQEDSFLFHGKIEEFLKYDFIGAPWPDHFKYSVGNGGFSLRTRKIILNILDKYKPQNILEQNEDVFFCKNMLKSKLGLVAPKYIAMKFAEEYVKGINPLGGHKFYNNNESLIPSYKCLTYNMNLNNKIVVYGFKHQIFNQCSENVVLNYNLEHTLNEKNKWIALIDKKVNWTKTIVNCLFIINMSKNTSPRKITAIIPEYTIKYPKTKENIILLYDFILRKINNII